MLDGGRDQAAGLREAMRAALPTLVACPLDARQPAHWVAQLARGLRSLGRRPVVLDASGGFVARSLGVRTRHELADLLQGTHDFSEVAAMSGEGIWAMRGERGIEIFVATGARTQRLLEAFAKLSHGFDDVLVAMPVQELASLAPADLCVPVVGVGTGRQDRLDAYDTVKQLAGRFGYRRFACVAHGFASAQDALADCRRLAGVARDHLRAELEIVLAGVMPADGAQDTAALQRAAQGVLDTVAAATV